MMLRLQKATDSSLIAFKSRFAMKNNCFYKRITMSIVKFLLLVAVAVVLAMMITGLLELEAISILPAGIKI
jgi:hypothetical protein